MKQKTIFLFRYLICDFLEKQVGRTKMVYLKPYKRKAGKMTVTILFT